MRYWLSDIKDWLLEDNRWLWMLVCWLFIAMFVLSSLITVPEKDPKPDKNIYLNEVVTFAKNVEITVTGIAVFTDQTEKFDEDGDVLSEYRLILQVEVEQTFNNWRNWNRKIKPSMFSLMSVNLEAKGQMRIFFEALGNSTFSILVGGALGQFPNIIEEVVGFAENYVTETINDTIEYRGDFKPIKLSKDSFKNTKLKTGQKEVLILDFPIKQAYLESSNAIVLSIDTIWNIEKNIFLMTRP